MNTSKAKEPNQVPLEHDQNSYQSILSTSVSNDLIIEKIGHSSVILSWSIPVNVDHELTHYIYRNNTLIASLDAQQSIYKDIMIEPDTEYEYEIFSSLGKAKYISSPALSVRTLNNTSPKFSQVSLITVNHLNNIGSSIHTFKASDPDQDTLYYHLQSDEANCFMVNQYTGELINRVKLSKNHSYSITVQVSDGISKDDMKIEIKTF